jgi:23S rRNA G2445 N2-methylase RlmL
MSTRILVTCPKAIAPILAGEIRALGLPVIKELTAGVETEGTLGDAMTLNLWLRTGHRVLFLVRDFAAANAEALYAEVRQIPWEEHIAADGYLSIETSVENPTIRDPRYAGLKCKDAIVDRIKEKAGRRPDSGPLTDRTVVFLYWKGDRCSLYFDTSGEPLSRRGYRKIPLRAPMQETLAAAVVLETGWGGEGHFVNPMCGSGTLAIEAALIGAGRAPGLLRDNFGFMHIQGFDSVAWKKRRDEAKSAPEKALQGKIIATDLSAEAVEAARKNAAAARVEHLIEWGVCDFAETPVPEGSGVVVFNPEYGERLGETKSLIPVYRRIGDFMKKKCRGYRGYVFTGNRELWNKVGLKPAHARTFFNSNIECRLLEFQVY